MDYKPLCDLVSFDATTKASCVSEMLCVLIISAPFKIDTTSAAIDPNNRSEGMSLSSIFPIKDLLDIETRVGYNCLTVLRF